MVLADLLRDPGQLESLGTLGRERARDYTWERCARLTYDL